MRVACPVDLTDYIKENAEEADFISFYDIEEDEILSNERIKTSSSSLSCPDCPLAGHCKDSKVAKAS